MKRKITLATILIIYSLQSFSQNNLISLFGGGTSATIKERETDASGWRITGLYEYNKTGSNFINGMGIGYSSVKGSVTYDEQLITGPIIQTTTDYEITTVPIYYAPKYLFNVSESFKPFINLMAGFHMSHSRTVTNDQVGKDSFSGWYLGGGAGFMISIQKKYFINASYEYSYLANKSYYSDGTLTSVNLGMGIRF